VKAPFKQNLNAFTWKIVTAQTCSVKCDLLEIFCRVDIPLISDVKVNVVFSLNRCWIFWQCALSTYWEIIRSNFLCNTVRKKNRCGILLGRRQVCRFQRRAGLVLQSHTGPAVVGPHTDTLSAGSPPGSTGWHPSIVPSKSDPPATFRVVTLNQINNITSTIQNLH